MKNPGVSIGKGWNSLLAGWLTRAPWVELRLDLMEDMSPVALVALRMRCMGKEHKIMLTWSWTGQREQPLALFREIIPWQVGWVDVPMEAPSDYRMELASLAEEWGVRTVYSCHYFAHQQQTVPCVEQLSRQAREAFAEGAGYVKFAVYTWTKEETDKLLEWCDRINEEFTGEKRVTLMIMGEYALISRRIAIHKEFPFVYSAPDADTTTAPGQPTFQELLT